MTARTSSARCDHALRLTRQFLGLPAAGRYGRENGPAQVADGTPTLAQPRAASRNAACTAVSSALRKLERSFLVSGAGPRVFAPSSRRCLAISRPTSAL